MSLPARPEGAPEHVDAYKRVLQRVLDSRPSGMRQRLAEALGKNRSFISQICNPGYATPIPVQHVESIFEICHFSPLEREEFLAAYRRAHPRRLQLHKERERVRRVTLALPDLGDEAKNRQLEVTLAAFAEKLAALLRGR
ncbi:MAG: hypothetical protein AB1452_07480 [Pseudomonadota bacterium]